MAQYTDPNTGEILELTDYERLERIQNLEAAIGFRLDEFGREVPDPKPMAMPSGFRRPETLQEQVARLVRSRLSEIALEQGAESFEESEDFDVDDEFDPNTPYEEFFDPALQRAVTPEEFQRNHELYKKRYLKAQEEYYRKVDEQEIMEDNLLRAAARERAAKAAGVKGAPPPPSDSSSKGA